MTTRQENIAACARAMGYIEGEMITQFRDVPPTLTVFMDGSSYYTPYNPYEDAAQCFALVEYFEMNLAPIVIENPARGGWSVSLYDGSGEIEGELLKSAICDCVAAMQLAKEGKK